VLAPVALAVLQASLLPADVADTLVIRGIEVAPTAARLDTLAWGAPQVTLATRQGAASVWLLRASDTVFVVARVPDRSAAWADALELCVDVSGDRAPSPAHDDFRFSLRRVLDSSVVYRGRAGRWEPPLDDPDWRVGPQHGGGGWDASTADDSSGWSVVLRLDPAWFAGEGGRLPGVAFQIHDDDPSAWYGWPAESHGGGAALERTPSRWVPVRLRASP
jgi:hypothetical protein